MKFDKNKVTIGDCCEIKKESIKPKPDTSYICYSLPAFDNSKSPEFVDGKDIKSSKLKLQSNTILFNKLNPKFRRVWNIKKLNESENNICSTEFLPLKTKKGIDQDFLYYYLYSPYFTALMDSIKSGTSNSQQRIDWKLFLKQELLFPSYEIQCKISSILRGIDEKIELNNVINNNLPA